MPRAKFFLALLFTVLCLVLQSVACFAADLPRFEHHFSGYAKTLNFLTQTTGLTPSLNSNPYVPYPAGRTVFDSLGRLRLKSNAVLNIDSNKRFVLHTEYDNQPQFGNFVNTGDFRVITNSIQNLQLVNMNFLVAHGRNVYYQQLIYRAILSYESRPLTVRVGRQLITWGEGYFFTPTMNLFNPFFPTQIELLDRRPGCDAVNVLFHKYKKFRVEGIYTPPGKSLDPQRYMGKISTEFKGFDFMVLGGRVDRNNIFGFDFAGNVKNSTLRGEFLYQNAYHQPDFVQCVVNADYNFPCNIHGLVEYYYNGQGHLNTSAYDYRAFVNGTIQQLGKHYVALSLEKDITPLLRAENRFIINAGDASIVERPEIQYSIKQNLVATLGVEIFAGQKNSEYGRAKNIYFTELKYSF